MFYLDKLGVLLVFSKEYGTVVVWAWALLELEE
jgi:hypothetical protein